MINQAPSQNARHYITATKLVVGTASSVARQFNFLSSDGVTDTLSQGPEGAVIDLDFRVPVASVLHDILISLSWKRGSAICPCIPGSGGTT